MAVDDDEEGRGTMRATHARVQGKKAMGNRGAVYTGWMEPDKIAMMGSIADGSV